MEARINSLSGNLILGVVPVFIGTTPDNQLVLSDPDAGAHHAEIRPAGQEYALIDLGVGTGTILNGYRLSPPKDGTMRPAWVRLIWWISWML